LRFRAKLEGELRAIPSKMARCDATRTLAEAPKGSPQWSQSLQATILEAKITALRMLEEML
tara:strand:+ start:442 stop:624 length:183 start_codon:yes stop_codon:yes gene_type:complete